MTTQTGFPSGDEPDLQYARALVQAGRIDEAKRRYQKVILGRPLGDSRALVCSELAYALVIFGRPHEALPYLQQALEECSDPQIIQTVENQMAICLNGLGRGTEAIGLVKLTPDLAAALSDPRLLARAAMTRASLQANQLNLEDAVGEYELAAKLALEAGDLHLAARAWHCASSTLLQLGTIREWLRFSDNALEMAESCRALLTLLEVHSLRALVYQMRGKWRRAEAELDEGWKVWPLLDQHTGEALWLITTGWYARAWRGDATTWDEVIAEVRAVEFPHPTVNELARWIGLAKLLVLRGRLKEARMELAHALERMSNAPPDPGPIDAWLPGAFSVADVICDVGDRKEADARYEALKPYGHLFVPHVLPPLVLGRMAALIGKPDEAHKWLMAARERAVQLRLIPFEGHVNYELGLWYERHGDRTQAEQYLKNALRIFEELGMPYYRDQTARHLAMVTKAQGPNELTPRQKEFFIKWARGTSPKEIAEELVVSILTVRSHLDAARRKTGTRNQNEALRWCIAHGLISTDELDELEEERD